jgi:hypothetical protein
MAKTAPAIVAFVGEVDSETLARVDAEEYAGFAEEMENVVITASGAMALAPGTIHIGGTPSNNLAVLQEWVYSSATSLCLVMSDEDLRFIRAEAFLTVPGAAATVGTWSNQSTTPPAGGGAAPDPGTGGDPPPGVPGDETYYFFDGRYWWLHNPDGNTFVGSFIP